MSATANTISTGSLSILGVIDPEDTPTSAMLADAYRRLNMMMGAWSLQNLTIPVTARETFALVAGKGGPSNPYTIGPSGNLNTTRPADLLGCGLLLNTNPTQPVEIPRGMFTDESYQAIQIKTLTSSLFTNIYYEATFPLGSIYLWPVPDSAVNSLVLYRKTQLGLFTSQTASYDLPEGADEAVEYNLAKRLLDVYSVDPQKKANVLDLAKTSLAIYKRSNHQIVDQPIDPMWTPNNLSGGYNINTGNY